MTIHTKTWFSNQYSHISRGQKMFSDLGYSVDIPWNPVYTSGWYFATPDIWGQQNKLTIGVGKPEYFAPDNIIRSNIIPEVNPAVPDYQYERSAHTYAVY